MYFFSSELLEIQQIEDIQFIHSDHLMFMFIELTLADDVSIGYQD